MENICIAETMPRAVTMAGPATVVVRLLLDGDDSLLADGTRVRRIGIDFPEKNLGDGVTYVA